MQKLRNEVENREEGCYNPNKIIRDCGAFCMLFLMLAVISSASMTLVLKWFRDQKGNRYGIILGNYLTCVAVAFLFLPERGQVIHGSQLTLLLGVIGGVLFIAALVSMQKSVQLSGAAMTAAFSKLGLIVSLLVSILWFHERPRLAQLFGLILVLTALYLLHSTPGARKRTGTAGSAFFLLLLTMTANGGGGAMSKIFEELGRGEESVLYFFWVFSTAAVLAAVLAILEYRRTGKRIVPKELAAGALVGVPNYFSSFLLLRSLQKLPSILVFPMFSTGTILLVLIVSALLFRERLTRRQLIGIALILAALVLLNLS